MRMLLSFLLVLAGIVSVSLSSPLPVPERSSSDSSLRILTTGPKPIHRVRPAQYRRHRDIRIVQRRDVPTYTKIFWAFGDSEPKPTDLPPMQDVFVSMSAEQNGPSSSVNLMPSATMTPMINANPASETIRLPLSPIPTSTTAGANQSTSKDPAASATLVHKHRIIFVAVVVGIITGLGITVGVCKVLARSGLCSCGGRKFTGAGRVDDKVKEKKLSWMKFANMPGSFGAGMETQGGKMTIFGRHYDEKGIERNPSRKVVSFEDEEKVVDLGPESAEPELCTLAYKAPSKNASRAVPHQLTLPEPSSLGLRVGETLHPDHFMTRNLPPTSFFDNDDHVVSASPSYLSTVSGVHCRTKSAPVKIGNNGLLERRESDKSSAQSSASSEWDIARAYGGPRYERARSVGAMSGLSVDEREWERIHRISGRSE
jgi:hypothetical protein